LCRSKLLDSNLASDGGAVINALIFLITADPLQLIIKLVEHLSVLSDYFDDLVVRWRWVRFAFEQAYEI
jgi:hypothetical protein